MLNMPIWPVLGLLPYVDLGCSVDLPLLAGIKQDTVLGVGMKKTLGVGMNIIHGIRLVCIIDTWNVTTFFFGGGGE